MFVNSTVFVLGAGASWHYGYPTGEGLVTKVIQKAEIVGQFFERSMREQNPYAPDYIFRNSIRSNSERDIQQKWEQAWRECQSLVERLRHVNPPVIDYFLGQSPKLQDIGKLLIAWVIFECEAAYLREGGNINRRSNVGQTMAPLDGFKDNWYRYVIYKLVSGCKESADLCKNNVCFVTFNYDTSLEYALHHGLNSIEMFRAEDIGKFLSSDRILHVYGMVRDWPAKDAFKPLRFNFASSSFWDQNRNGYDREQDYKEFIDSLFLASKKIKTIDPHDKSDNKAEIKVAADEIMKASCVYILGYGFDENNNERIGLNRSLKLGAKSNKAVLFTNYGDINRVNKKASKLFFTHYDKLLPPNPAIIGKPTGSYYCEKSTRDVYEALELDFDSLEEQLVAGSAI